MPRADAKRKVAGVVAGAKKGAGAAGKKSKLYNMPEKIKEGTILKDLMKSEWKIGPSIGTGGFGEIYSACKNGENKYDYVVKCEPHDNGPLFVEMHFYMRNAKLDDIRKFQKQHNLKSLGMPYMIGNGSAEINGIKHRFIVMPRYGSDVAKHFINNGRKLPEPTCYRLALQMLDVYEFIHGCGYVHADLKAANILLGYGAKQQHQAYLVDFGLASHYTTKDFKPDPKKMHNGTIEYTSRDAHLGVPTMRADLEILGYNLIEWLGIELPWVRDKILATPSKVQKAKEDFMSDVSGNLKKLFTKAAPPSCIIDFLKYVANMEYNETPDYEKCRKIFQQVLKSLKAPATGDLNFVTKASTSVQNKTTPISDSKAKSTPKNTLKKERLVKSFKNDKTEDFFSEDEMINASDDDDDDVMFENDKTKKKTTARPFRNITAKSTPHSTSKSSPMKQNSSLKRKSLNSSSPKSSPSPTKRSKINTSVSSPTSNRRNPTAKKTPSDKTQRQTPLTARANIRMSPAVTMSSSRSGKTIINDRLTPNKKPTKTYEFNFELDVSMDANVIVNVKRKKKPLQPSQEQPSVSSSMKSTPSKQMSGGSTPVTKINVRKVANGRDDTGSPRTPAVTVKKSKRFVTSPT